MSNTTETKKGRWWKWPLIILLVLAFCFFTPMGDWLKAGLTNTWDYTKDRWNSLTGNGNPANNEPLSPEEIAAFQVCGGPPTWNAPPVALVSDTVHPVPPRFSTDSLALGLNESDPASTKRDLQAGIWRAPLTGYTWGHFITHLKIGGVEVGSINPCLDVAYRASVQELNDRAAGALPIVNENVKGKEDYQLYARYLNSLIDRIGVTEITKRDDTDYMYRLAGGGVTSMMTPEVEISNDNDPEPLLVFSVSRKGLCAHEFAANVKDSRPVALEQVQCKEPVVPVAHKVVPPPGPSTPPGTPPPGQPPYEPPWQPPYEPPVQEPNCTTHPVPECFPVVPPGKHGNHVAPLPGQPIAVEPRPAQVAPNHPVVPNTGALPGAPNTQAPASPGGVVAVDDDVQEQAPEVNRDTGGDVAGGNAPVAGAPTGDGAAAGGVGAEAPE